jgi:hypothetical protein
VFRYKDGRLRLVRHWIFEGSAPKQDRGRVSKISRELFFFFLFSCHLFFFFFFLKKKQIWQCMGGGQSKAGKDKSGGETPKGGATPKNGGSGSKSLVALGGRRCF